MNLAVIGIASAQHGNERGGDEEQRVSAGGDAAVLLERAITAMEEKQEPTATRAYVGSRLQGWKSRRRRRAGDAAVFRGLAAPPTDCGRVAAWSLLRTGCCCGGKQAGVATEAADAKEQRA